MPDPVDQPHRRPALPAHSAATAASARPGARNPFTQPISGWNG
jgi:hypothetical protein